MNPNRLLPLFLSLLSGPLFARGAEVPTVINVEVDYMEDATHSHRPSQLAVDAVVQMFACHGITLNFMVDEAIPHIPVLQCQFAGESFWGCSGPTAFRTFKLAYSQTASMSGWRYAIMGHDYTIGAGTGSSGLAQSCGGDFVVTLGSFSETDIQVAGTFAHELGHTLGLGHTASGSTSVSGEFAPNYASLMDYRYQLIGVKTGMENFGFVGDAHLFKDLDYSNGRLPTLVETALSESRGTGMRSVDWDCNGVPTPGNVLRELDAEQDFCANPGIGFSTLVDQNDWSLLCDSTELPEGYLELDERPSVPCITVDEYDAFMQQLAADPATELALRIEPCVSGQMVFVDPAAGIFQLGTGALPHKTLSTAELASPANSVLFLQPGNYTSEALPIVITKPLILTGPGGAVIAP